MSSFPHGIVPCPPTPTNKYSWSARASFFWIAPVGQILCAFAAPTLYGDDRAFLFCLNEIAGHPLFQTQRHHYIPLHPPYLSVRRPCRTRPPSWEKRFSMQGRRVMITDGSSKASASSMASFISLSLFGLTFHFTRHRRTIFSNGDQGGGSRLPCSRFRVFLMARQIPVIRLSRMTQTDCFRVRYPSDC